MSRRSLPHCTVFCVQQQSALWVALWVVLWVAPFLKHLVCILKSWAMYPLHGSKNGPPPQHHYVLRIGMGHPVTHKLQSMQQERVLSSLVNNQSRLVWLLWTLFQAHNKNVSTSSQNEGFRFLLWARNRAHKSQTRWDWLLTRVDRIRRTAPTHQSCRNVVGFASVVLLLYY